MCEQAFQSGCRWVQDGRTSGRLCFVSLNSEDVLLEKAEQNCNFPVNRGESILPQQNNIATRLFPSRALPDSFGMDPFTLVPAQHQTWKGNQTSSQH